MDSPFRIHCTYFEERPLRFGRVRTDALSNYIRGLTQSRRSARPSMVGPAQFKRLPEPRFYTTIEIGFLLQDQMVRPPPRSWLNGCFDSPVVDPVIRGKGQRQAAVRPLANPHLRQPDPREFSDYAERHLCPGDRDSDRAERLDVVLYDFKELARCRAFCEESFESLFVCLRTCLIGSHRVFHQIKFAWFARTRVDGNGRIARSTRPALRAY